MIRYLKLYLELIKNNVSREMQYRPDFVFTFLGRLIWLILTIFFFSVLYGHTPAINGWTLYQSLLLVGIFELIETSMYTMFWMNFSSMPTYINEGELDFLLLKPIDAQFLTSLRFFSLSYGINIITPIVLIIVSAIKLHLAIGVSQIMFFAASLLLSMVIFYSLWFLTVISLFWLNKIYEIQELFVSIFAFMRYPTSIYEGAIRGFFTFIVPIIFTVIVPVQAIMSALDYRYFTILTIIALTSFVLARIIWKYGLKHYSSASS